MLRLRELSFNDWLRSNGRIATLLAKTGRADLADRVFERALEVVRRRGLEDAYRYASADFMLYALRCGRAAKAYDFAEAWIERDAGCAPALAIRMHRLASGGETEKARALARRLLDAGAPGPIAQAAREVLGDEADADASPNGTAADGSP
jgi:hypothetical protein